MDRATAVACAGKDSPALVSYRARQISRQHMHTFPISLEGEENNEKLRKEETFLLSPWSSLLDADTISAVMTVIQLDISLGESYTSQIAVKHLRVYMALCGFMLSP